MKYRLEICADSVISALNAQEAGADRIELCENLQEGGTTPGPGKIITARKNLGIMLNVIIRPRGSDFLYSAAEYDIMKRDIGFCGEAGVDGVVLGILLSDGRIDVDRTSRLAELARPMSVTFHRAFDMCSDPFESLEDVITAGADRLLTSGHSQSAADGADLISELVKKAGNRIIIMPGSGINETNIAAVAVKTGAEEFHLSGRKQVQGGMSYRKEGITMGGNPSYDEYSMKVADVQTIKKIIRILNLL